jgi:hypothetical protein
MKKIMVIINASIQTHIKNAAKAVRLAMPSFHDFKGLIP